MCPLALQPAPGRCWGSFWKQTRVSISTFSATGLGRRTPGSRLRPAGRTLAHPVRVGCRSASPASRPRPPPHRFPVQPGDQYQGHICIWGKTSREHTGGPGSCQDRGELRAQIHSASPAQPLPGSVTPVMEGEPSLMAPLAQAGLQGRCSRIRPAAVRPRHQLAVGTWLTGPACLCLTLLICKMGTLSAASALQGQPALGQREPLLKSSQPPVPASGVPSDGPRTWRQGRFPPKA